MTTIFPVPALKDNYIWVIADSGTAAVVDPGDAAAAIALLERERLKPEAILCTHRHNDHVGGARELAARYAVPVFGPAYGQIAAVTHPVRDGDRVEVCGLTLEVMYVPGHTSEHIAFFAPGLLFCGDTLFSAGCGRINDGGAAQLFESIERLRRLPDDTKMYCGHEYTAANLRFAQTVEPDNADIARHIAEVDARRQRREPSLPTTIGLEKRINPFLRTDAPTVRRTVEQRFELVLQSALETFAALRRWKDEFR